MGRDAVRKLCRRSHVLSTSSMVSGTGCRMVGSKRRPIRAELNPKVLAELRMKVLGHRRCRLYRLIHSIALSRRGDEWSDSITQ